MKRIYLSLSFIFCSVFILTAQLSITENTNATTLAQYLAGPGVTISNATIVCPTAPGGGEFSGFFNNANPGLGVSDGVILSTGEVLNIEDAVGSTTFITTSANAVGDTDLDTLLQDLGETYTTNDACVLEFDLDIIGDTLTFNYAMGSEEYPNFVCSTVNDIFGFFISGPNPAGGNYVNQNLALIPGTNLPVSINTVNNGGSGGAATCYNGTYSNFMNPNPSPISSVPNIAFNQITKVLQAKTATVPCQQYHFKLAIADGGDWAYDSGVFLEAGSFSSTGVIVASSSILGQGFNTMVENCIDGQIEFILEDGVNNTGAPIAIPYTFSGSATHLVDFYNLPGAAPGINTAIVPVGDSSVTIQLFAIPDLVVEGIETIEINVQSDCGFIVASTIDIAEEIPFVVAPYDDSICIGQTIDFEITGAQTYSWVPTAGVSNPASGIVTLAPTTTTTYTVTYTLGTCTEDSTFTIYVSDLTASLTKTDETCPDDDDGTIYLTYSNGVGNISYLWDGGNTDSLRTGLSAGFYCVTISDEAGCDIYLCDTITQPDLFLSVWASPSTLCTSDDSSALNLFTTLSASATYYWSPSNLVIDSTSNTDNVAYNLQGTTIFTVTATDQGCTTSAQTTVNMSDLEVNYNVTDVSCNGFTDGSIIVTTTGGFFTPTINWASGETTYTLENLDIGTYCATVSDFNCSFDTCIDLMSNAALSLNLTADDTVLCNETSTNIYINANITNGTYSWLPTSNFSNTTASDQNTATNLSGDVMINVTAIDENNCVISDSILIAAKTLVIDPNYTDTTTGSGSTIDIGVTEVSSNNLDESISYIWSPSTFLASSSSQNTTTTPTQNIVYTITSEADGCTDIDSILVHIGIDFQMPNAFTPNNDGVNEKFYPVISGGEVIEFKVYNRWGDMIHNNAKDGWNGKFKGQSQATDIYNYFIKVSNGNEIITKFGNVSLIY